MSAEQYKQDIRDMAELMPGNEVLGKIQTCGQHIMGLAAVMVRDTENADYETKLIRRAAVLSNWLNVWTKQRGIDAGRIAEQKLDHAAAKAKRAREDAALPARKGGVENA
jgi:hypothetical protein